MYTCQRATAEDRMLVGRIAARDYALVASIDEFWLYPRMAQ